MYDIVLALYCFQFLIFRSHTVIYGTHFPHEYVIFEQLSADIERNFLFYCDQYGFRHGHSTELASVRFVNDLIRQIGNFKI